jgi:hypothetical protein
MHSAPECEMSVAAPVEPHFEWIGKVGRIYVGGTKIDECMMAGSDDLATHGARPIAAPP